MSSAPSREPESGGTTVLSSSVHSATQTGPAGVSSPALSRRSRSESGSSCWQAVGHAVEPSAPASDGQVGAVVRRGQGDRAAYVRPAAEVGDVDADHDAARGVADQVHRRRPGLVERRVDGVAEVLGLLAQVLGPGAGRPHDAGVSALAGQGVGQHLERGGRAAVPRDQQHGSRPVLGHRLDRRVPAYDDRHRDRDRDDQRQHRHAQHQPAPRGGERVEHATSVRRDPSRLRKARIPCDGPRRCLLSRHAHEAVAATAVRGGLHLAAAQRRGDRAGGAVAGHLLRHLLRDRAGQPLRAEPRPPGAVPGVAGLGLPGHPGAARHHRQRGGAAAAGQALDRLPAAVPSAGARDPEAGPRRPGAGLDRGPGRLGDLPARDRDAQQRPVVPVGLLVPRHPLRPRLGRHRVARGAHRGQAADHPPAP